MKISQLIKELEGIKAEHGDIPVAIQETGYDESCDVTFSGVAAVTDYCYDYDDPVRVWDLRKHVRLYE